MSTAGWLPAPAGELFGPEAVAEESYEVLTVDVPPSSWLDALETARTTLTCTYFDWLSAVDEPGVGFRVAAHVVALHPVRRLLLRTTVPHEAPVLPSAVGVYAGAAWHERETHEMFGVTFEGHPSLEHLLLPENFEGHPLRKDFVLAARVAKAWPGAKEPGESEHGGPKRRQMLPPGVPDPNEWGPLKGQLPPAPARPARAAGDRPVRRTRTAAEGSAQQPGATEGAAPAGPRRTRSASEGSASQTTAPEGAASARPRRMRSASEGSASQAPAGEGAPARPRRTRSANEGSVSQASTAARGEDAAERKQAAAEGDGARTARTEGPAAEASVAHEPGPAPARPRRNRSASQGSASQRATEPTEPVPGQAGTARRPAPRSSDAPWHHARPAPDAPAAPQPTPASTEPGSPESASAEPRSSESSPAPEAAESQTSPSPEPRPDPGRDGREPAPGTPGTPDDPDTPDDPPTDPTGGPQ
ncbi:NADH-quinone oxidoreductase subunit C [Streptomyces sp. NEAU-sy36]|uniref:NADH-quinone oxidoreductase subunit C n=1 Tax=unclassified Streptomyces TaxID=2593676 RepID=UPI0015D58BC3|nr:MULTISPECIES: NADH-quinone oxidoreductase subunit C [unclassified Streptomyces]QLJ05497.1 NADH-quinone oxidoreductase subunit C [Streptomyces sp. NEAU-sy36]